MVREGPSEVITSQLKLKDEKGPLMQEAGGECSLTEGRACAEAPKWQFGLSNKQRGPPLYQSLNAVRESCAFLQITSLGL